MNSEMYLRWVKNRLLPTFKKIYGDKQMILIQDNVSQNERSAAQQCSTARTNKWSIQSHTPLPCSQAPYHHKREVGGLGAYTTKKSLYEHLRKVASEVTKIKLPKNETRGRDQEIEVDVSPEFFEKSASKMIPDADEIRSGFVRALREANSDKVNCQVEGLLKAHGHSWIWTPPYCPWLQPVRAQRKPARP